MREIEPDMVLGKEAVDGAGDSLGEIIDVGLYTHGRVKFLLLENKEDRRNARRVSVESIDTVSPTRVQLRIA